MSGHSKWATIKHKKGALDAKRGKIFTKLMREIMAAAKAGGGDPANNPRLRTAMASAREVNMPSDNIERAVKKGTGEVEGVTFEEVIYEGYGPQGVAILVHCLTDNKNRSAAEIRSIFTKNEGSMAGAGSVAWIFEKKGLIAVDKKNATEDVLMEAAINAGADDLITAGEQFEVLSDPQHFEAVKQAVEKAGIKPESAVITMIPKNQISVSVDQARAVIRLIGALEDHDDVQHVYANCDIPDEVMKEIG